MEIIINIETKINNKLLILKDNYFNVILLQFSFFAIFFYMHIYHVKRFTKRKE